MRWFVPEFITLPLAARRCLVRNTLNGAALELSSGEHAVLTAELCCVRGDELRACVACSLPTHRDRCQCKHLPVNHCSTVDLGAK